MNRGPLYLAIIAMALAVFSVTTRADCFDQAFNQGEVPDVKPRRKIHRTDLGCSSYACVFDRGRSGSRVLHVYLGRRLPNRVSFGTTGGWAEKSIATLRAGSRRAGRIKLNRRIRARVRNAVEIARGVEVLSLVSRPELIWSDRDFHDRITAENNCDEKRNGLNIDAFYEIVKVPKKAWARQRRQEGWFDERD